MNRLVKIACCLLFGGVVVSSCGYDSVKVCDMLCEYNERPITVDTPNPRFVWNYCGNDASFKQDSFIFVITTNKQNFESDNPSGFYEKFAVESNMPKMVYENGEELTSHTKYYWQVKAFSGNSNLLSPIDSFVTSKLNSEDWVASWISDSKDKEYEPAPMLRKSFTIEDKSVKDAYLYVSAAAYCDLKLNGKTTDSTYLNPGYTHYDKRNLYSVCEVSDLLKPGENVISAVLGNGFYNEIGKVSVWDFETARWRDRPRMICELRIDYTDGTSEIIVSDETWKTSTGPYLSNNIYAGDFYDARLEKKGWDIEKFDDSDWGNAIVVSAPSGKLVAQKMPPIKADRVLDAIDVKNFGDTLYVYDFGKNISGLCELTVSGEKGTRIDMKHAEIQKSDGMIEPRNIDIYFYPSGDKQFQTDTYILSGEGEETFKPMFSYHGFRYVEVKSDKPIKLSEQDLKAKFIHTAVKPVGRFECSNDLLNKFGEATKASYLSNLMSIPTDCPQREKNGWTADAHISMEVGLLNFDGITVYEKWVDDMVDNQTEQGNIAGIIPSAGWGYSDWIGPVWDAVIFIVPMNLYNYYGESKSIEKIWPVAEKYLQYLENRENEDGTVTYGIGDWVYYNTKTPTDFTTSCYYYLDNLYMSKFAELLGKDGSKYERKAKFLKDLINEKYFDKEKMLYANGSQAAQSVPLYLGIVPSQCAQKVADNLSEMIKANNNILDFGMLGSKTVLRMLTKYGHAQQAYELAAQTEAPSWCAWIKNGLTSLPETWTLSPVFKDASLNHIFLGDMYAWLYNDIAGINFDASDPGFKHVIIRPHVVDGLDWVDAEYNSVKGVIKSAWKKEGDKVEFSITIPQNCRATLCYGGEDMKLKQGETKITLPIK